MAQHDYVISDDTGANVRADLNNVLQAILSANSGSSAPSATAPGQLWYDTANGLLKVRNAADSGWNTLFSIAGTPYSEGNTLTIGTEIGDIVQLADLGDTAGTPTLPAVDGSQLTGIPGIWEDIASGTISGASEQTITYTAASYRAVKVFLSDIVPATDGANFRLQTSTDGGSNYDNGASDYGYARNANASVATDDTADHILLTSTVGSATGEGVAMEVTVFDPSTAEYKRIFATGSVINEAGSIIGTTTAGMRKTQADVDSLRFFFSSGNIASGRYHAIGLKI